MTKEPCFHVFQWHVGRSPTEKELMTNIRISKCPSKSPEKTIVRRGSENYILGICVLWETVKLRYFIFLIDDKAVIRYVTVSKIWWQRWFLTTLTIPPCNLIWLSPTCTELWDLLSHCLLRNGLTPNAKSFLCFCNN